MEKEKLEAIKLWSNDPCGAVYAEKYAIGSKDFFKVAMKYRYEIYAPWLKHLIDGLDVSGKKVLEIGCGMGMDLLQFAKKGAEVIGVDLVPRHIELANRLFEIERISFEDYKIFLADAESLPFNDMSFNFVYSFGVLHHTPNIEKAIDEIWRVLKPGGRIVIGLYHKNSWHYWFNLFFVKGIIKGELNKSTMDQILSQTEFTRSGIKPLVRVYSRRECLRLFKKFIDLRIKTFYFTNEQIPRVGDFLPKNLSLFSFLGWYVFVIGSKVNFKR